MQIEWLKAESFEVKNKRKKKETLEEGFSGRCRHEVLFSYRIKETIIKLCA